MSFKQSRSPRISNTLANPQPPPPVVSSIKTINGLALAFIKTLNGIAMSSIKTFKGLNNT